MNKVFGYLELNGNIFKITSIDELKEFVVRVGSEFKELNGSDFAKLCQEEKDTNYITDDCGVKYSLDKRKLLSGKREYREFVGNVTGEYKVKDGTIAIGVDAFTSDAQVYYDKDNIPHNRYYRCYLKRIYLPNSIIAIGSVSFYENKYIEELFISPSLQYIGLSAFKGCCNLNEFEMPKTLKYLGANAFEGCNQFKKVYFGDAIKKIGSHAFKDCKNLEVVSIPGSVEIIGSGVFEGCDKLKEIRIPKGTTERFSKEFPFCKDKLIECDEETN